MNYFEKICSDFPDIDNLLLIYQSDLDASRKTYMLNNVIIKSHKINEDCTAHLRQNDLKMEYEILKRCKLVKNIPKALYYCKNKNHEILFISYLPGIQLLNLRLTFIKLIKVVFRLSIILFKLSVNGVCHNDIIPHNILITDETKVSLIDFDQAIITSPLKALVKQFLGFRFGESKVSYSINTVFKDFFSKKFPKAALALRKLVGKSYRELKKLPELNENSDPKLAKLVKAWKLAQESNASAPGLPAAYYALDYMNHHFPGERSWADRWDTLKNLSNYSGKTIIELGCNMGLLSTYLIKEAGANKCVGVDHDEKILESAKLISEVYNVKPEFIKVNFDSRDNWEEKLLSFNADIIFALNVLNWVNDKERFLKFLSNFPEVIFEGHDLLRVERERFEKIGFNHIDEIGYSERKRIILRCRK